MMPIVDRPWEDDFLSRFDELLFKLEKSGNDAEQLFYLNSKIGQSHSRGRLQGLDKGKHIPSLKKLHQDASRREAATAKRMQDLIRQFGSIFRQITQHKWAWPFMQPVDVEGLGLHDYYQIIDRPMDFSIIKNQMEAKGYKHVKDICCDVRLVFTNAIKYNEEKSHVHMMAKGLQEKFEEKWLQFLPKVIQEEKKLEEEENEAQMKLQLAKEAAHAKLARDLNNELCEVDSRIAELGEMVVPRCRHIPAMEKRKLGIALGRLDPEELSKALDIVAESNTNLSATAEEVELDINAQSDWTLWMLKLFVKDALRSRSKCKDDPKNTTILSKRKRERDMPFFG